MRLKLIYIGLIVIIVALLLGNLAVCKKVTNDPRECGGAKPDKCNGDCVNLQVDANNCGACGNTCNPGEVCRKGNCTSTNKGNKATCTDGVKDGKETDVDCGGSTCSACADGQVCKKGTDCSSGTCKKGICQVTSGQPIKTQNVSTLNNTQSGVASMPTTVQTNLSATNLSATNISAARRQLPGRQLGPGIGGTKIAGFACDGALCTCKGDEDCNDMFTNAGCGDVAQCHAEGDCWCFRQL